MILKGNNSVTLVAGVDERTKPDLVLHLCAIPALERAEIECKVKELIGCVTFGEVGIVAATAAIFLGEVEGCE